MVLRASFRAISRHRAPKMVSLRWPRGRHGEGGGRGEQGWGKERGVSLKCFSTPTYPLLLSPPPSPPQQKNMNAAAVPKKSRALSVEAIHGVSSTAAAPSASRRGGRREKSLQWTLNRTKSRRPSGAEVSIGLEDLVIGGAERMRRGGGGGRRGLF